VSMSADIALVIVMGFINEFMAILLLDVSDPQLRRRSGGEHPIPRLAAASLRC
jgi:hypothetical protein